VRLRGVGVRVWVWVWVRGWVRRRRRRRRRLTLEQLVGVVDALGVLADDPDHARLGLGLVERVQVLAQRADDALVPAWGSGLGLGFRARVRVRVGVGAGLRVKGV